MYRIVRIISSWAIFPTSALNRAELISETSSWRGRWAYNTSWAYNIYYTVVAYKDNIQYFLKVNSNAERTKLNVQRHFCAAMLNCPLACYSLPVLAFHFPIVSIPILLGGEILLGSWKTANFWHRVWLDACSPSASVPFQIKGPPSVDSNGLSFLWSRILPNLISTALLVYLWHLIRCLNGPSYSIAAKHINIREPIPVLDSVSGNSDTSNF